MDDRQKNIYKYTKHKKLKVNSKFVYEKTEDKCQY